MLSFEEFQDKKHIIMDKFNETIIMNRNNDFQWLIYEIPKNTMVAAQKPTLVDGVTGYLYYRERMASYGFKQFPIIME